MKMVLVRGNDALVGIEFDEEATWGTDPAAWDGAAVRLPFVDEGFRPNQELFPDSQELAAIGALKSVDYARRLINGSLTLEPRYDAIWWNTIFSDFFGTEDVVLDRAPFDATTPATGYNTHIYTPGTALYAGHAFRIWKSGPNASGYMETYLGNKATRMVWTQTQNDRPRCQIEYLGKTVSIVAASGTLASTVASENVVMKARDLGRGYPTHCFKVGATLGNLDITGFTLTIDKGIAAPDAFANDMLTLAEPGQEATRSITLEIDAQLEQAYYNNNKPMEEFINKQTSSAVIVYTADTTAAAATPFYIVFQLPAIRWTEVTNSIAGGGIVQLRAVARAIEGDTTALTAPYNEHAVGTATDLRVMIGTDAVLDGDAKFSGKLSGSALGGA